MAEVTYLTCSIVIFSLTYLQMVACMNMEQICANRCLYRSGGILCNCNAMHFKGKRSEQENAQEPLHSSHYLARSQQLHSALSTPGVHAPFTNSDSFSLNVPGERSGSKTPKSPSSSSTYSLRSLNNGWDLKRVNDFLDSLGSLENPEAPEPEGFLKSPKVDFLGSSSEEQENVLPFLLLNGGDGDERARSSSSQSLRGRSIGKSSRATQRGSLRHDIPDSDTGLGDEFNDGNDGINTSGVSGKNIVAAGSSLSTGNTQGKLLRLRQVLKQVLRGR